MKLIATIAVDLETSPIGTRSRLADDLFGQPVLRRTIERALAMETCADVCVLCPSNQAESIHALLDGLPVKLETHAAGPAPYRTLVRAGRMWGLNGWRGGIGSLCVFDEDIHITLVHAMVEKHGADAILSIPAAAPLLDPRLLDAMARHFEENLTLAKMTVVQAPPGLGAVVIDRGVLSEIAKTGQPPGAVLVYQPNHPLPDLTGKEACYRPSAEIVQAAGRLLVDTRRSSDRVRRLFDAGGESWDALKIARWLTTSEANRVADIPEEIEIELTTDDPLGEGALLRPRGAAVGQRGPIDLEIIRRIAEWIANDDDVRIVLAGFGEPTAHPRFGDICRILRDGGAAAIAVRTGASRTDARIDAALFETPVDLVEVTLDAASVETYLRVHGTDVYQAVCDQVERWLARRSEQQQVLPMIVPSMIKANETLDDLETFVDHWQNRLGMVQVTGYSHHAGQLPRRAVTETAPPDRAPCRRVFSRMIVLADGRVTTCDQDFAGTQTLGLLTDTPISDIWRSDRLETIRSRICGDAPLCAPCTEWHRP